MLFFRRFKYFLKFFWLCGNLSVKITTKQKKAFIWFQQNLLLFFHCAYVFQQMYQHKGDILFDYQKKCCDDSQFKTMSFRGEIPHPKNTKSQKFWYFWKSGFGFLWFSRNHWFKKYKNFAQQVDFAYWRSLHLKGSAINRATLSIPIGLLKSSLPYLA